MEKIWLKSYPKDVPHEIDPDEFSSLIDLFERSVAKGQNRNAFENFGSYLTFAELDKQSRAFASCLQNKLRLHAGNRVAIMMPNLLQYPVALFGSLRAGLTV